MVGVVFILSIPDHREAREGDCSGHSNRCTRTSQAETGRLLSPDRE